MAQPCDGAMIQVRLGWRVCSFWGILMASVTDTQSGDKQSLYRTASGSLLVYVEAQDFQELSSVALDDLSPLGRFSRLGDAAGYSRPLTILEAIGLGPVFDGGELM